MCYVISTLRISIFIKKKNKKIKYISNKLHKTMQQILLVNISSTHKQINSARICTFFIINSIF